MELWDIYDKNKVRTGRTMERNHFNLADDEYHLTVLGVIMRPDKSFLITKRVKTKAWAPGWWEVSGGAAQAGEESADAVRREVLEETGLDVNNAISGGYISTKVISTFRKKRQTDSNLHRLVRSKNSHPRESSFITTVLPGYLKRNTFPDSDLAITYRI